MANTFLTPSIIAKQGLMVLQSQMVMAGLVYKDHGTEFTAAKVGDTITIRKPPTFVQKSFTGAIDVQNATETGISLTIDKHADVSVALTAKDMSLSLQSFTTQILEPVMRAHAQGLDDYIFSKYYQVYQTVGTAGSPPASLANVVAIDTAMNNAKIPLANRVAVMNPAGKGSLMGIDQFTAAQVRGDGGAALRDASMGRIMALDWYMSQNVPSHTRGTLTSPVVNGAVAAGAVSMAVDGGSASETMKAGDVFTVAGVTGYQFTVLEDATASSGAIATLKFSPAAPTGGFADNAALTVKASHAANLAFHPFGFALGVVPLELPQGAAYAQVVQNDGMAMRVVYGYDISSKTQTMSWDFLLAGKWQQPELAFRVLG